MRILIFMLGLLIVAAISATRLACAEDDPPPDPPPSTESESAAAEDSSDEAEAEAENNGNEEAVIPEGVHRQRPRTEEQERQYKQRKTREDTFLNFPEPIGPAVGVDEFYNPDNWLNPNIHSGLGRYIVQDETGAVIGSLTYDVSLESDPLLGEYVHIRQRREFEPASHLDLWLFSSTLKPRRKESRTNLAPASQLEESTSGGGQEIIQLYRDSQLLQVEYLFDRATVYHEAAGMSVRQTLRQMPYSYDIDQLPLLVRQLNFLEPDWPFEVAVCDPRHQRNLPLSIEQPRKVENLLSAEPRTYRVYELPVRMGDNQLIFWVERLAPHRLVKYTDGEYTYTLTEYLERE